MPCRLLVGFVVHGLELGLDEFVLFLVNAKGLDLVNVNGDLVCLNARCLHIGRHLGR